MKLGNIVECLFWALLSVKGLSYKLKSLMMMMMVSTYDEDKFYLSVKVFSIVHMLVLYGHIC